MISIRFTRRPRAAPTVPARKLRSIHKRALARTSGMLFASAVLLAVLFLALIAIFDEGVASQLSAQRNGSLKLAAPSAPGAAEPDEFLQQKKDARQDELPAQF
jgi:hypothetical protein